MALLCLTQVIRATLIRSYHTIYTMHYSGMGNAENFPGGMAKPFTSLPDCLTDSFTLSFSTANLSLCLPVAKPGFLIGLEPIQISIVSEARWENFVLLLCLLPLIWFSQPWETWLLAIRQWYDFWLGLEPNQASIIIIIIINQSINQSVLLGVKQHNQNTVNYSEWAFFANFSFDIISVDGISGQRLWPLAMHANAFHCRSFSKRTRIYVGTPLGQLSLRRVISRQEGQKRRGTGREEEKSNGKEGDRIERTLLLGEWRLGC